MVSPESSSDRERPALKETEIAMHTFHADLACLACADAVDHALRHTPAITDVHVNYADRSVQVAYDAGRISLLTIQTLISTVAYGCRCAPADTPGPTIGGDLGALAHQADMAAVTMGTNSDRMQYEFPSTAAGHRHHMEHMEHEMHAAHAAQPGQTALPHGDHTAMGHDMSDPHMAKAMEADMRNRFVVALALSIPTLFFSPLAMSLFHLRLVGLGTANWLMLLFSTPVVWWAGWPFIGGAATSLRHRALNMSVLIATGVLAAWGFSVALTLTVGGETFYDASVMLVTFVLFGHWMEMKSRRGTTDALRALFDLVPPTATVLRDGVERDIPTGEIVVGDRVRLRPGDKVPVDGVVADGATSIDEALVTGESAPVDKEPGDPVIGGSINRGGSIVMEATKVGSDTALAHIVALVERAQTSKAPGQRLADRAAAYLVVVAVGAGILTFLAWSLLAGEPLLTALTFAISAVVIACPDALGLATPTAVAVGTGLGAKHNILIKDAATLEGIARITAIVPDKTGTLTEGKPHLTDVLLAHSGPWTPGQEDELLRLVASAEHGSEHPLIVHAHRAAPCLMAERKPILRQQHPHRLVVTPDTTENRSLWLKPVARWVEREAQEHPGTPTQVR